MLPQFQEILLQRQENYGILGVTTDLKVLQLTFAVEEISHYLSHEPTHVQSQNVNK